MKENMQKRSKNRYSNLGLNWELISYQPSKIITIIGYIIVTLLFWGKKAFSFTGRDKLTLLFINMPFSATLLGVPHTDFQLHCQVPWKKIIDYK